MNELECAETAIKERKLGSHPMETITRVAKYYMHSGRTPAETRQLLDRFVMSCDDAVSVVAWSDRLDTAVKQAKKYPVVVVDSIHITERELEMISELDGVQTRRLAFTLLCAAKYFHGINSDNQYWVNAPDNEIMRMANINTSIKRQSLLFSKLRDAGMIRFSNKVDNLSVQVTFADECGKTAMEITDMRNVGYQYMRHTGGGYYVCANCGITFRGNADVSTGRKQKYCAECAVKIRTRQQVEAVMRRRRKTSEENIA